MDEISNKLALESDDIPTSTTILGPFWSPHAPFRDNGDTIVRSPHSGEVALMHGRVTDLVTKQPIANAVVDIWEASSSGKYDFQEPDVQEPNNLRGKFRTDKDGYYHFYCLKPTAYSLPTDGMSDERGCMDMANEAGPSYELLTLLDRHPMRPAHIHLMVPPPPDITDPALTASRSATPNTAPSSRSSSPTTTPTSRATPSSPSRTTWSCRSSRAPATPRPRWTWSTTSCWRPRGRRRCRNPSYSVMIYVWLLCFRSGIFSVSVYSSDCITHLHVLM